MVGGKSLRDILSDFKVPSGQKGEVCSIKSQKKVTFALSLTQVFHYNSISERATAPPMRPSPQAPEPQKHAPFMGAKECQPCKIHDKILEVLSDPSIAPDIAMFNKALEVFASKGLVDFAKATFFAMLIRGVEPNQLSFEWLTRAERVQGSFAV